MGEDTKKLIMKKSSLIDFILYGVATHQWFLERRALIREGKSDGTMNVGLKWGMGN